MELRQSTGAKGGPGGSREVERHGSAQRFPVTGTRRKAEPGDSSAAAVGTALGPLLGPTAAGFRGITAEDTATSVGQGLIVSDWGFGTALSPDPLAPGWVECREAFGTAMEPSPWLSYRTQPPHTARGLGTHGHPGRMIWGLQIHQAGQCARGVHSPGRGKSCKGRGEARLFCSSDRNGQDRCGHSEAGRALAGHQWNRAGAGACN